LQPDYAQFAFLGGVVLRSRRAQELPLRLRSDSESFYFVSFAQISAESKLAESMSKCHPTTKRMKDTKDSELLHFSSLNYYAS
jgi:hypothetical protein